MTYVVTDDTFAALNDQPVHLQAGDVILDAPRQIPAVWGDGRRVLWSKGEYFLLVGEQGVGKSSIAQQLALRILGTHANEMFGLSVPLQGRVLYVAADRPEQIKRSMRRMVDEGMRPELNDRLRLASRLPVADPRVTPWLVSEGIAAVFIDSLYNVIDDNSRDQVRQFAAFIHEVTAAGIELCVVHHDRKRPADKPRPVSLNEVAGHKQITQKCGSALFLVGEPGDEEIEGVHLKQPGEVVGPLDIAHDHQAGSSRAEIRPSVLEALKREGASKVSWLAELCFGDASSASLRRVTAKLGQLERRGRAGSLGSGDEVLWTLREQS